MSYKQPLASTTQHGVVKIGNGINVSNGVISTSDVGILDQAYFYDTTIQTNPVASGINLVTFNSAAVGNIGISLVAGTRLTVSKTANYNLQFTVQLDKTDAGTDEVDIWILRNGVPYPDTNTRLSLVFNNAVLLAGWSYLLALSAGDFIEVAWESLDTNMRLFALGAQVAPIRPATPSARVTLVQL